jgi:hypothetical protein
MRGFELRDRFAQDSLLKMFFIGVLGADEVKSKLKRAKSPSFCVVNVDKTSQEGRHWYCVFKDSPSNFDVMDSLGTTLDEVQARLGKVTSCRFNQSRVQANDSKQCGEFCYYFCHVRYYNYDLPFEEVFGDAFEEDVNKNEQNVAQFWQSGVLPDI